MDHTRVIKKPLGQVGQANRKASRAARSKRMDTFTRGLRKYRATARKARRAVP